MTVFCLWALSTGTANARVYVDPDSAPGKEYEIPLDRVRGDAAPGGANGAPPSGGGTTPAPAFGVGLESGGSEGDSGDESAGAKSGSGERDSGSGGAGGSSSEDSTSVIRTAGNTEGGVGPTLTFTGLGVGALLLGVAAGFVLRRRTQQGSLQG
jgi:hypothetical protein